MRPKLGIILGVIAYMLIFVFQAHAEIGIVKDINIGAGDSFPQELADINGTLYFAADDGNTGNTGNELWTSDSSPGGTIRIKDINFGPGDSSPRGFTIVNGTLFFSANRALPTNNGRELWTSDGTGGGTVLVKDINPGAADSNPENLTNVAGTLFFAADGVVLGVASGVELWKSDGTAPGTELVQDINVGAGSSLPSGLTNLSGILLFSATDGALNHGRELWKHDPVAGTTVLVKDINPGAASSDPSELINVNGTLFFAANDGTHGIELWKSDGTEAGTVLVKDISAGAANSDLSQLTNVAGILFFVTVDAANGKELWKSDGTAAGTDLVENINPGAASSDPDQLTNVSGILFFAAVDGTHGKELWKHDPVAGTTELVKDINTAGDSLPRQLAVSNGILFFAADDGNKGVELWQSDGTEIGTVLAKDINPGAADSNPENLTNVAGDLFFRADDGPRGVELFVALTDGTTIIAGGSGCFFDTAAFDIPTDIHTWILKAFSYKQRLP